MKAILTISAALAATTLGAHAATFYTIAGVTTANVNSNFYPASNMIQGSGVGFDAAAPHNQLGTDVQSPTFTWVTDNRNAANDYYNVGGTIPILTFDLGSDVLLSEISTWGYADGNTNGAKDFSLRFATSAEGTGGFGTSITYNPAFETTFATAPRDSNVFSQNVTARYVQMTITDNWRGFQGPIAGGDRVGLGEVAFATIPEPSTALLGCAALGLLLRRRR